MRHILSEIHLKVGGGADEIYRQNNQENYSEATRLNGVWMLYLLSFKTSHKCNYMKIFILETHCMAYLKIV